MLQLNCTEPADRVIGEESLAVALFDAGHKRVAGFAGVDIAECAVAGICETNRAGVFSAQVARLNHTNNITCAEATATRSGRSRHARL